MLRNVKLFIANSVFFHNAIGFTTTQNSKAVIYGFELCGFYILEDSIANMLKDKIYGPYNSTSSLSANSILSLRTLPGKINHIALHVKTKYK
jgi:hypothetical protein